MGLGSLQHHMDLSIGLLTTWQLASSGTSDLRERKGERKNTAKMEAKVFLKSSLRSDSLFLWLHYRHRK